MYGTENVPEIQSVFASSISTAMTAVAGEDKRVKQILIFNITYAYSMVKSDDDEDPVKIDKALKTMKLQDKEWTELLVLMTYWQSKAGIRPMQTHLPVARTFKKIEDKLESE